MPFNTPEKAKAYRLQNKERRNRQWRDWFSKKDATQFNREKYVKNREYCLAEAKRQYQKAGRERHLLKTYKITQQQYDDIFLYQASACGICKSTEPRGIGRWYVDHNHSGHNEVRGILCLGCNRILGYFETRPDLLQKCIPFWEYIQNPPAQAVLNRIPLSRPTEISVTN